MKTDWRGWKVLAAACIVVLAAGAAAHGQDNMSGAPYHGYTGVTFDTTHSHYDYLVDGSLTQDNPAEHEFRTLQAAYAAAPAGTPGKPTVIGIKPDVYFLKGTETEPGMRITKNYITLLGLTNDRRKVVLAGNRGNEEGASNNGYLLMVNADGFTAMNLTIVNYCNLDYDYPGNPAKDLKMRSPVITQAVALQAEGDRHVYSHVAFLGRLDTLFIRTTRSYFTNVFVEGTDDFIGGGAMGVWNDSEVYFPTGNGVMSASGITFINTVFKAKRGLEFYKGTRNPVTLIRCVLPVNTPQSPVAWMVWKAPVRRNLYSLTYQTKDAKGHAAVIMDSIVGRPAFTLSRELTAEQAKAFNPWNLLRAAPGGPVDDWDPAHAREEYQNDGSEVFRMALKAAGGEAKPGEAGAAAEIGNPFASLEAPGNAFIRTGGAGATITATVQPARAVNTTITWSTPSKLVSLSSATGKSVVVTGNNKTNRAEYATVRATAANGFYVTSYVYVEPAYIAPPSFASGPILSAPVAGKLSVRYAVKLDGRDDQSLIAWYQCSDQSCAVRREVAVSRGNEPMRQYSLTVGDVGKYIQVEVQPKCNISEPGPARAAVSPRAIRASDVKTRTISPNFRDFVAVPNDSHENGMWTVLGTWTISTGDNLVNGYGLRVASRGATLLYQQNAPTGNMRVKVVMTPEKTAGQGFGIAGSPSDSAGPRNQKADIYIKYDPRTKSGFSLRFWRTTLSADECMFQLYQIVDGIGHPISGQQQLTGVFKPNTTLILSILGSTFTATGSNTADKDTLSLRGTITPNQYGGAGVSWTGSVPVGNSVVLSEFQISYPGA